MKTPSLEQQIRSAFQLGPASHMTHVDNLSSICTTRKLFSFNQMRSKAYSSLANHDVQAGRSTVVVPVSNRSLHDYVPLYFGFKTPMVAYNQSCNEQLLFLRVSLNILGTPGVVFSDGNARSTGSKFYLFNHLDDLKALDCRAVQSVRYAHDQEFKRKKQAELRIPDSLGLEQVIGIICISQESAKPIMKILRDSGTPIPLHVNPGWYFRDQPIVRG